jgi:hypothetical protein
MPSYAILLGSTLFSSFFFGDSAFEYVFIISLVYESN